jgi:ribosomal protein S18 acetylase RimI-like enzyme
MLKDYIEIKNAVPTDALPIAYAGRTTFCETWAHLNTPEDMKLYIDKEFNFEKIEIDLQNNSNTFLLAFMNGKVAGYVKLRRDRTPKELEGSKVIEIERIYALKEFQKNRIGFTLMNRSIEIAASEKMDWIWLGVNEDNEVAINFYKRFGFEVFGEKTFLLGNKVNHDVIMKRKP